MRSPVGSLLVASGERALHAEAWPGVLARNNHENISYKRYGQPQSALTDGVSVSGMTRTEMLNVQPGIAGRRRVILLGNPMYTSVNGNSPKDFSRRITASWIRKAYPNGQHERDKVKRIYRHIR